MVGCSNVIQKKYASSKDSCTHTFLTTPFCFRTDGIEKQLFSTLVHMKYGTEKYNKPFENLKLKYLLTKPVLVVQFLHFKWGIVFSQKIQKLHILNSVNRMAMKHHPAHVPTGLS